MVDVKTDQEGREFQFEIYDTESLVREPIKQLRMANGDNENTDVLDVIYPEKYG